MPPPRIIALWYKVLYNRPRQCSARTPIGPENPVTLSRLIKQPSAYLPVGMSFAALATVLLHLARFGVTHEADEGTSAHLWQLLMATQLPIIAFFAIKWLPQAPKEALVILALQLGAGLAALAPVFLLGL
jgi:hypothetical protein